MRLIFNQSGWPELYDATDEMTRRAEVRNLLHDPNLGENLRMDRFKVISCKRVKHDLYKIEISARKNVIHDIIGNFSDDSFVIYRNKRHRVYTLLNKLYTR